MDSRRPGVYVRISSDPEGLRAGVERQEADCRALVARRGWGEPEIYVDNDVSAYSGKRRPDYERMLADIESGSIDGVVCWHTDRLHRSPKELEHFIDLANLHRTALANVSGDIDLSTSDGRFTARTLGNVARKSSEDASRRLTRKHESLAQQGAYKGGKRPFGFEPDGTTVRAEEAELIRDAAKRILAGESVRGVCREWSSGVIHSPGPRTTRDNGPVAGRNWTPHSLKRILTSPRITGLREYKGEVIGEAVWDAIIDRGTWERLRGLLNDPGRSQSRARSYLLTGFAFCSFCDGKMVAHPRMDKTRAYVCGPNIGGCNKLSIKAEPLEELVGAAVLMRLASPGVADALRAASGEDDAQRDLLESLRADQETLERLAVDHYSANLISRSQFLAAQQSIETRMDATKRALQRNRGAGVLDSLPATAQQLQTSWDSNGFDWQRSLIGAVLERVIIKPARRGYPKFDLARVELVWRA